MKRRKNNALLSFVVICIIAIGAIVGIPQFEDLFDEILVTSSNVTSVDDGVENNALVNVDGNLEIHFIDVGQADSIYICQGGHSMIIDGGNNADGDLVVEYLKNQGVSKLEYVVATHPHEDHIGGLDDVIDNFDIGKVLMPNKVTTTKTFENLLNSIKNKQEKMKNSGLNISLKEIPKVNNTYNFSDASFVIYAPNLADYGDDLNNYSIVIKMIYGNNTFLFTGDAETISEKEMLNAGYDLKSDLLKVGHHGSSTSTSKEFLDAVSPKYAVISVEKNNTYNLPKKTVMDRLKNAGITVYRTDECGTIVVKSDGKNITFDKSPGSYSYMK